MFNHQTWEYQSWQWRWNYLYNENKGEVGGWDKSAPGHYTVATDHTWPGSSPVIPMHEWGSIHVTKGPAWRLKSTGKYFWHMPENFFPDLKIFFPDWSFSLIEARILEAENLIFSTDWWEPCGSMSRGVSVGLTLVDRQTQLTMRERQQLIPGESCPQRSKQGGMWVWISRSRNGWIFVDSTFFLASWETSPFLSLCPLVKSRCLTCASTQIRCFRWKFMRQHKAFYVHQSSCLWAIISVFVLHVKIVRAKWNWIDIKLE